MSKALQIQPGDVILRNGGEHICDFVNVGLAQLWTVGPPKLCFPLRECCLKPACGDTVVANGKGGNFVVVIVCGNFAILDYFPARSCARQFWYSLEKLTVIHRSRPSQKAAREAMAAPPPPGWEALFETFMALPGGELRVNTTAGDVALGITFAGVELLLTGPTPEHLFPIATTALRAFPRNPLDENQEETGETEDPGCLPEPTPNP